MNKDEIIKKGNKWIEFVELDKDKYKVEIVNDDNKRYVVVRFDNRWELDCISVLLEKKEKELNLIESDRGGCYFGVSGLNKEEMVLELVER